MAEIKGMWLQDPDDTPPDVMAVGAWKCPTCGFGFGSVNSTWPSAALRFKCLCGTDVEIAPGARIDGRVDGAEG